MKQNPLIASFILLSHVAFAQTMKPIYDHVARRIVTTQTLASYAKNTWLENLVMGSDSALYVTNYPTGLIFRVTSQGTTEEYARINGKIAGIARYPGNCFLVDGWDEKGASTVFLIDAKRQVSKFASIDGGVFPNGMIPFGDEKYLIADSYAGCIWELDTHEARISVWLKDDLLKRSSSKTQNPAANGLKIYNNALYVSNTDKQILVKIPLDGYRPGKAELFMKNVGIDDFDFDEDGNIYAATHVYHAVIKIGADRQVSIIAGLNEGAAGCTAVLVGKDLMGKQILYVTTNGGMSFPPPTGVEESKIIIVHLK